MSSSLDNNRSTLGRMLNNFAMAIEKWTLLPKVVVIIPDNDLINYVKKSSSYVYGTLIHWLAAEFNKMVDIQKDRLPKKAVKKENPTFIWIAPPQHMEFPDNEERVKFTGSLKRSLDIQPNHLMLQMKKIWHYEDRFTYQMFSFTELGFTKYWASVDSALQFWEQHLAPKKKLQMKMKRKMEALPVLFEQPFNRNDAFKWRRNDFRGDFRNNFRGNQMDRRRFATPPRRR